MEPKNGPHSSVENRTAMFSICVVALCFLMFIWKSCQRPPKFPPGPSWWPFVGNLPIIIWKMRHLKCHHLVWADFAERYGNLVGLKIGWQKVVVVSGKELIRECTSREVFDGRPDGYSFRMRSFGKRLGVVFADGPLYVENRRLVLKYLRNFGYGRNAMEQMIMDECTALISSLDETVGKPIQMDSVFDVPTVNILWTLVAGKRFELSDARLIHLCDVIKQSFRILDMSGGILNNFPFLKNVAPDFIGYTKMKRCIDILQHFISSTIQEHRETLDVNCPKDVIDTVLIEMEKNKDPSDLSLNEEQLRVLCLDLFQAGSETTSTSLAFLIIHIIRNPGIQQKVQHELDTVIGRQRRPTLQDRNMLPYTEAVMTEGFRISTVAPVGIAHMALKTAKIGDYTIEKGTTILYSIYSMHMGKNWQDPEVFRPERFINENGKTTIDDSLMTFGNGKRRCIGEALAKTNVFLFLTSLLQQYSITHLPNEPLPSTEGINGITLTPKPFKAILTKRF